MISTSTSAPVRFTPSWLRSAPNPPVYLLRAGAVLERERLEADLAGDHRADRIMSYELDEAARSGIRVLAGDDAEHILSLMDAEAAAADEGRALDSADAQILAGARQILSDHWPDYRALLGQMARRNTVLPVLAFQRFCVGWEGRDAEFALGANRMVCEASLASVPSFELRAVGIEAYRLLYVTGAEKNFVPPSSSSVSRKPSPAAAGSKAAGKSPAKSGKRTRA